MSAPARGHWRVALTRAETDNSGRAPTLARQLLTASCLWLCRNKDTHWGPRRTPSLTHDRIVRPRSFSGHPSENCEKPVGSREPDTGTAPAQAGGADVWGVGVSHRPTLRCLLHRKIWGYKEGAHFSRGEALRNATQHVRGKAAR